MQFGAWLCKCYVWERGTTLSARGNWDAINEMTEMCWRKRADLILKWKRREKWPILGLGAEKHKVIYLCDEKSWLFKAEVNTAGAGSTNRSGSHGCRGLTVLPKSSLKVQRISWLLETAEEGNGCFLCTSWSSHIGNNRTLRSSPLLLQHSLPLFFAKLCLKVLRPIKLHEWFCGFYCSVFLL